MAGSGPQLDPLARFGEWLDRARAAGLREPTAAALATATPDGAPTVRMVLLKTFDERGFVFSTNYESRKAGELESNARACLLFHWGDLERQVRIEGRPHRVSDPESDAIFRARPRGSRLAAWASPQSRAIGDRAELERLLRETARRFPDDVPRPSFWGGYRLVADSIEFWQGHVWRLHDRLRYLRDAGADWTTERLAP